MGEREGTPRLLTLYQAADHFDWGQPQGADWDACFALQGKRFCGRAKRWAGHEPGHDHAHVSLRSLLMSLDAGARPSPALKEIVERMRLIGDEFRHWDSSPTGAASIARNIDRCADALQYEIERAASLTAREQAFFEAAKTFASRHGMIAPGEYPTQAQIEDTQRIANEFLAAYRALLEGPTHG